MSEQIGEELRKSIRDSELSAGALSKLVDVNQPTITEFLRGAGISLSTAQKIADYFGLVLKKEGRRGRPT